MILQVDGAGDGAPDGSADGGDATGVSDGIYCQICLMLLIQIMTSQIFLKHQPVRELLTR